MVFTDEKTDVEGSSVTLSKDVYNYAKYNLKTKEYEFMGPIGALAVTIFTPITVYMLFFFCNETGCPPNWVYSLTIRNEFKRITMFDFQAFWYCIKWMTWCVCMWAIIPSSKVKGIKLRNGSQLEYRMNGFRTLIVTLLMIFIRIWEKSPRSLIWVYDHFLGLITGSLVISIGIALFSYLHSFYVPQLLAEGGNSENFFYDFFIGRPLNPRIFGDFDLKVFCELRPGMIGWFFLIIAMACKQWTELGTGYITDSMMLVLLFQGWYIVDSLWNEQAVLTTMDVTTDGFGFMLAFGDLTWVPFTYSLQARYLASHPVQLGIIRVSLILACHFMGYYIFRGANSEKNAFRSNVNDPSFKNYTFIETKAGTKLLTSGWWGKSRHINYLGDWIMAWAWCLPCGFSSPIPYFYVVYFAILLLHRERRDDVKCAKKYGKDWEEYKKKVPFRIIPYIY